MRIAIIIAIIIARIIPIIAAAIIEMVTRRIGIIATMKTAMRSRSTGNHTGEVITYRGR